MRLVQTRIGSFRNGSTGCLPREPQALTRHPNPDPHAYFESRSKVARLRVASHKTPSCSKPRSGRRRAWGSHYGADSLAASVRHAANVTVSGGLRVPDGRSFL